MKTHKVKSKSLFINRKGKYIIHNGRTPQQKRKYTWKTTKEKRKEKVKSYILSLGLRRRRVFFFAWLRGRRILGLRVSLLGSGLSLFQSHYSILGLCSFMGC